MISGKYLELKIKWMQFNLDYSTIVALNNSVLKGAVMQNEKMPLLPITILKEKIVYFNGDVPKVKRFS